MDLRFSLLGLIIGFLIGLTGMGGGSLMTPLMILLMGVKPLVAVGTDLAYGAITRIVGSGVHLRQGTVHRRTAFWLASGSVPASILGVGVISAIKNSQPGLVNGLLLHAIAWALIFVALVLALKPLLASWITPQSGDWRANNLALADRKPWILTIVGVIAGFLVGLTSVGAGSLIIVGLLFLYPRWESRDFVGTDVFHATLLVSAASIAQFAAGNVNLGMMTALLVGSIPGIFLGSRMAFSFPERLLRFSMAGVLLISGAKLL